MNKSQTLSELLDKADGNVNKCIATNDALTIFENSNSHLLTDAQKATLQDAFLVISEIQLMHENFATIVVTEIEKNGCTEAANRHKMQRYGGN